MVLYKVSRHLDSKMTRVESVRLLKLPFPLLASYCLWTFKSIKKCPVHNEAELRYLVP